MTLKSPRLLLVAATTGYQTRSFAEAAKRQGIEVVLATDRCHVLEDPWRDNAIAVRFEEPRAIEGIDVDGIVAVADRPTLVAALTAASLDLPWHSPAAVTACRDKYLMRQLFAASGLLVPETFASRLLRIPPMRPAGHRFPVFSNPLDSQPAAP